MKTRKFPRAILGLALLFILTIPGVFAGWQYSIFVPIEQQIELSVTLMPFEYPPEEVLPSEAPENHQKLIDSILNSWTGGLNSSWVTSWFIPRNLDKYDGVLYSRQSITFLDYPFQNLLEVFILPISSDSGNLYFIIERISETELAVYTASKTAIDNGNIGDAVEVYRTVLQTSENGDWAAVGSKKGYAYLKMITTDQNDVFLSFDPRMDEWHPGEVITD